MLLSSAFRQGVSCNRFTYVEPRNIFGGVSRDWVLHPDRERKKRSRVRRRRGRASQVQRVALRRHFFPAASIQFASPTRLPPKPVSESASARFRDSPDTGCRGHPCRPPRRRLISWGRGYHRFHRAEVLADCAHVDVPAFALRRVLAGEVAHRREVPLRVDRGGTHHELTLE